MCIFVHLIYDSNVGYLLHEDRCCENIARMEEDLQNHFEYLPLGTGRLWRDVAKDGYTEAQKNNTDNSFKLFVTLIPKTKVKECKLIVNR